MLRPLFDPKPLFIRIINHNTLQFFNLINLPLVILLEDVDLLKSLEDLALNGARGINVVGWAGATVDATTVQLSESTNTNALAKVDVASNGGYYKQSFINFCFHMPVGLIHCVQRSVSYQHGCRTNRGHRERAPCRCQS